MSLEWLQAEPCALFSLYSRHLNGTFGNHKGVKEKIKIMCDALTQSIHNPDEFSPIVFCMRVFAITARVTRTSLFESILEEGSWPWMLFQDTALKILSEEILLEPG